MCMIFQNMFVESISSPLRVRATSKMTSAQKASKSDRDHNHTSVIWHTQSGADLAK